MPVAYGGSVTTLQDAAGVTGDGVALDCKGAERVTVQILGTFSATITFEGTLDDTNWVAVGLKTAADGAAVTTATAPGVWKRPPDLALSQLRARISGFVSGVVTVLAQRE